MIPLQHFVIEPLTTESQFHNSIHTRNLDKGDFLTGLLNDVSFATKRANSIRVNQ